MDGWEDEWRINGLIDEQMTKDNESISKLVK